MYRMGWIRQRHCLVGCWFMLMLVAPRPAWSQALDESCVVTINSRSANVNSDGSFFVQNIPFITAPVRVEAVCTPEGLTLYGATDYLNLVFQGTVQMGPVRLSLDPIPTVATLEAFVDDPTLKTGIGPLTTQMHVSATLSDGSVVSVPGLAEGTYYSSSNPNIAGVGPTGLVTAFSPGVAFITATNDGVVTVVAILVIAGDDPRTTVEGYVVDNMDQPIEADIYIFNQFMGTSDPVTGLFQIEDVPALQGPIAAAAVADIMGVEYGGKSLPVEPVPNGAEPGFTDVGIIQLDTQTRWTCNQDGNWSDTLCWVPLHGSDAYPDNGANMYNVILPPQGTPYTVTTNVNNIELVSMTVTPDTTLAIGSSSFDPGALTNNGLLELRSGYMSLTEDIVNDGVIRFDTDTSGETIQVLFNTTLGGTGSLMFPNLASDSFSTHRITGGGGTLTNGPDHTIEGGPGEINSPLTNNGEVRANEVDRTLYFSSGTKVNNHLMIAEDGGRLLFASSGSVTNNDAIQVMTGGTLETSYPVSFTHAATGSLSCDASSTIKWGYQTTIYGPVTCDGLMLKQGSYVVDMNGASVTGGGEYRQSGGGATYIQNGATVEFATVDLQGGSLSVQTASEVTARDLYTFTMTSESSHAYNAGTVLRMTGGTAAGPTDYQDFAAMEIGGTDYGTDPVNHVGDPAGFTNNFHLPHLIIGANAKVNLFDVINNGNRNGPFGNAEALYVDTLEFEDANGILNLNGLHLYFNTLVGDTEQIVDLGG